MNDHKVYNERKPYQSSPEYRYYGGKTGEYAEENGIGDTCEIISYHGYDSLNDSEKRYSNGIRGNDNVNFFQNAFFIFFVKRQYFINISFHFTAADKHKIENENQNEEIDGEAGDVSHKRLPYVGNGRYYRSEILFLQEIVSCTLRYQVC